MKEFLATIGVIVIVIALFACGAIGYGAYRVAVGASDAATLINDFPALDAVNRSVSPQQVIGITVEPRMDVQSQPVEQVIVVTATAVPPLPTYRPTRRRQRYGRYPACR